MTTKKAKAKAKAKADHPLSAKIPTKRAKDDNGKRVEWLKRV